MNTILLPIKPEYAYKILSGEKKYEYRKRIASHNIERIVIYATSPVSRAIGEVSVSGHLEESPENLWEATKDYSGISLEKYKKYFHNKETAFAYCLKKATVYQPSKALAEFGLKYVPQSFAYLKVCPFCGDLILYKNNGECVNSKSVEHIIPESLGNIKLIIPNGHICDKCNNYFATHIENEFLNLDAIKSLRTFHFVTSKKGKIPDLSAFFAGEETKIDFDAKTGNAIIKLSPYTVYELMANEFPKAFITHGVDINELKNNYVISRFLIKIFSEINLYKALEYNHGDLFLFGDDKIKELFDYVRKGSRCKKIYSYTVNQTKEIVPLDNDDFICSVEITHDKSYKLTGMVFKLFELEFILNI